MLFGNHKDCEPEQTITKIRSLLMDIGITLREDEFDRFSDSIYSVRLEDPDLPEVGTNGKGVSPSFALASAYAEFMERLQNGILYLGQNGIMPDRFAFPDERQIPLGEYAKKSKKHLIQLVGEKGLHLLHNMNHSLACVPFWNVFSGAQEMLPLDLLFSSCGSNGMCAGNTPFEALQQGLCEILERYAIKKLFLNPEAETPVITLDQIADLEITKIINELHHEGIKVIVKDLTNNGKYPVIAVIVLTPDRLGYRAAVASDVLLETAIQRCITEIFQGKNRQNIEQNMIKFEITKNEIPAEETEDYRTRQQYELINFIRLGKGHLPISIFTGEKSTGHFRRAFLSQFTESRQAFQFLLGIIKRMRWKLYIRDVSFLDFNSYYLYIPQVSNVVNLRGTQRPYFHKSVVKRVEGLLNIKNLADSSLKKLASGIQDLLGDQIALPNKMNWISSLMNLYFKESSDLKQLPITALLAMVFLRLNDSENALRYLNLTFNEFPELKQPYFQGVQFYLWMKSMNLGEKLARSSLQLIFNESLADEIIQDICDPVKAFQYFSLPECGHCSGCSAADDCLYEVWSRRMNQISKQAMKKFPNQADLKDLFI